MNELQKLLTPKKLNKKYIKKRFGVQDYDGGYILVDNIEFDNNTTLGFGVDGDYSCELQLQQKYQGDVHLFDGTVDIECKEQNVFFHKQNITPSNINQIFDEFEKITFKMDIEGSEYGAFESLSENNLQKIIQMSVEFHFASENYLEIFKKLNKTHKIFHVAANNCCGIMRNGIPSAFEISYINREYCDIEEIDDSEYPTHLDRMNTNLRPWPLLFKWW